jgi:hypothetical protein
VARDESQLEDKATEAVQQIISKNYAAEIIDNDISKNIVFIGMAFHKKRVCTAYLIRMRDGQLLPDDPSAIVKARD